MERKLDSTCLFQRYKLTHLRQTGLVANQLSVGIRKMQLEQGCRCDRFTFTYLNHPKNEVEQHIGSSSFTYIFIFFFFITIGLHYEHSMKITYRLSNHSHMEFIVPTSVVIGEDILLFFFFFYLYVGIERMHLLQNNSNFSTKKKKEMSKKRILPESCVVALRQPEFLLGLKTVDGKGTQI